MSQANALGNHVAIGLGRGEFHIDGLVPKLCLCHQVGQREVGIRSGHEVAVMILQKVLLHALSHTAENADDEGVGRWVMGVGCFPLLFECSQHIQSVVYFLLGIVAHRTGVKKDGIGLFHRFTYFIASHLHHRGHHFRVGHVHLASVGFNIEFLHNHLSFIFDVAKYSPQKNSVPVTRPAMTSTT